MRTTTTPSRAPVTRAKPYLHPALALLLALLPAACTPDEPADGKRFALRSPRTTGIDFANTLREDDTLFNLVDYYYLYNGGGVAVGDVNGDDLPDLYFTGNMVSSRLYLNRGGLRFEDVTRAAGVGTDGWVTGATFVDIDGDGDLDLYVCRAGPHPARDRANLLFINERTPGAAPDGAPAFVERAAAFGLADTSHSTQAAFFDYDHDNDLDLYLLNHSNEPGPNQIVPLVTDGTAPTADRLYRQRDDGTFEDVSVQAGIVHAGFGLGVAVDDLDGDGWEDVYVANDFMPNDHVYLNNRDGTFREQSADLLKHHSYAAMGTDLADINNDGLTDIVVVDMRPPDNEQQKRMAFPMTFSTFHQSLRAGYQPQYWRNTLQLNNGLNAEGRLTFSEIGQYAGVDATDWSWAPLVADFDGDGLPDLWITNGYRRAVIDLDFIDAYATLQRRHGLKGSAGQIKEMARQMYDLARVDRVFRNRGDLTFEDVSEAWGITTPSFSNGAAYADLDGDGDLDVVVNNVDAPAALYENRSDTTRFLKVQLRGAGKNVNGLGATVRLYCGGRLQRRHQAVTRGYQSSVDHTLHFGLGRCDVVDSLRVDWPGGGTQRLTGIAPDGLVRLDQRDARPAETPVPSRPQALLTEAAAARGLRHQHREEPYDDFMRQRLAPHQHSRMGPGAAVGDVNGDGREDVFVGGAFRHVGRLFLQQADHTFRPAPLVTETPKYQEDMGALFFDADGDSDLDLYVASGGNEYPEGSDHLQDRLYLNDGRGRFSPAAAALPDLRTSTGCVLAADYDADGDLDLFVGGRLKPALYPLPGRSYLLRNDTRPGNGPVRFTDVTETAAPGLREAGMVTGGLWTDFTGDGRVDLVLVGEFMPVRFFAGRDGRLVDVTDATGLAATEGWWNSIAGGDFDRDGDVDYVAGNLGLNTRFHASPSEPVTVYAGSLDFNSSIDPILTHFVGGKEYPVPSWDDFTAQLPGKKLLFPTYERYAKATFGDLFTPNERAAAAPLHARRFESSYFENLGGGRFALHALPGAAQLAPLYGLVADDVDGDGLLDVLAVGNSYAPEVITGRHDALVGVLLRGDGRGGFAAVPHPASGFFVDGDAKALVRLMDAADAPLYLATRNDDWTRAFVPTRARPRPSIAPGPLDAHARITLADGTVEHRELYHGSGYLSHSSRRLLVPHDAKSVVLHRYDGAVRTVSLAPVPGTH